VRNGGGEWSLLDPGRPVVVTSTGYTVDPVDAVATLMRDDLAPSLSAVYIYAMVGHALPDDDEPDFGTDIGERMRKWAGVFVHNVSLSGRRLDGTPSSLDVVETLCDDSLEDEPDAAAIDDLTLTLGAYVGKLVRKAISGEWTIDSELGALAVEVPGRFRCYPMEKAGKRPTEGPEHNLRDYYESAIAHVPENDGPVGPAND
jgi:hypothetical protein